METFLGHVTEIKDDHKFIVKFTIKDYIEDAIAYPINQKDEPNIGDPIWLYKVESIFGWSWLYQKLKLKDHMRMKFLDQMISVEDDHIEIHAGGTDEGEDAQSVVMINNDGSISIKTTKEVTVETPKVVVKGENTVDIETTTCTIKANDVNITGGNLTTVNGGTCAPTSTGGFCGIPVCVFSGAPHIGNKITGT